MRRTGRYIAANSRGTSLPYKVVVEDRLDYEVYTMFIRENCRRGNWSKVLFRGVTDHPWTARWTGLSRVVYVFADEQDAMTFKLAFGQ